MPAVRGQWQQLGAQSAIATSRADVERGSLAGPVRSARAFATSARAFALLLAGMIAFVASPAVAQTARQDFYISDGTINAAVLAGNSLIVGGQFTHVGPVVGCGVPVDPSTAMAIPGFPQVTGQISAIVSDGSGGWFIGGLFSQVGASNRANLAHILSDMSVAAWDPGTDGQVNVLALRGDTLYVGGAFTVAGGQARSRLAAIDASSGAATSWNPGASDQVRAFALAGSTLYVGGRFTVIAGVARNRIAALDPITGTATSWNPGASLDVLALAERSGTVYAAGAFTVIGGVTRNRIAAIDSATAVTQAWNPNSNGQVSAFALGTSSMFLGGSFNLIGGQMRLRVAEVSLASGAPTSWDPAPNGAVSALTLDGSTLYVGGDFTSIGGQLRSRIAGLSTTTGLASAWNPAAYSTVQAIAVDGSTVYLGGVFGGVGGTPRNNLAAIDLISGAPTAWDPDVDGPVLALERSGNSLYVGGSFTKVGGQPHAALASVDLASGLAHSWNPPCNGQVSALLAANGVIYVGGAYSSIGGQVRSNLAALDTTTGVARPWAPETDGQVFTLTSAGGLIYVGGSYTVIGGQARDNLAAVDPVTALSTSWNPDVNGTIRALISTCGSIYVGGFFTQIGGFSRNRLAALDASTGIPTSWNPSANGPVFALSLNDGVLYVGGVLNIVGGENRNRLAALDPVSGLATPWNPNVNSTVRALAVGGGAVYAGGSFSGVGSTLQDNVVALPTDGSVSCPVITMTPASLPYGTVGTAYSQTISASGGRAPYCWSLAEGELPSGLALDPATGVISGTPSATGTATLRLLATDANGCTTDHAYSIDVFAGPIGSTVAASTAGLCVNPAHPCVSVPFVYSRDETAPARAVSVTFQIDTGRLALCTPGNPYGSIAPGSWLDAFPNSLLQVVDNGGGSYTVDALILGQPCGATNGGTLFTADLQSVGADGLAAITVTATQARDCDNNAIGVLPAAPESLLVQNAPVAIAPSSLPPSVTNAAYHQVLTASNGTAPFAFTLAAGTLPPGLTLSSAGVIDGITLAPGTFAFTVAVTDTHGCVGSRAYSIAVDCAAIAVRPFSLPDGSLGVAYAQTLTPSAGRAPFAWSVTDGALPDGLTLSPAGLLSGTPTIAGTYTFTASVSDSVGCSGSRSFTVTAFPEPITATIGADATGLCLSGAHPYVSVPFVLTRTDTTHARAASVSFLLDTTRVALRTPAHPDSSVHVGPWFDGMVTMTAEIDAGNGSYVLDVSILGEPCGPSTGGTLFTLDLVAVAPSGTGTITALATHMRSCDNTPLPVGPGAPALLTIGSSAPGTIADLAAAQVTSGNGGGSTTGIVVTWTAAPEDSVRLYRAPYASYPAYAGPAPDSAAAPGSPWTLVSDHATSGLVDHPPSRGSWYYVAQTVSPCGDVSAVSNRTTGTLDYVLGDVSDGYAAGTGNNAVGMEDVSLLGANYGIGAATIGARGVGYLDVGPTVDLSLTARPVPDGMLDFEDLMVVTGNFATSMTSPSVARRPTTLVADHARLESFHLDAPGAVTAGATIEATLRVSAAGRMHGFSVRLAYDPGVVEPVSVRSSGFVESAGGLVLSPGGAVIDAALLGTSTPALEGDGDVARVVFRVLRDGDPGLRIARVLARDAANRPLGADQIAGAPPAAPSVTALMSPAPNPFRSGTTLTFSLAHEGPAQLVLYSVDGRRVRTLADGFRPAGVHSLPWDGRDDSRTLVAPGVYYARLVADGRHLTTRLVYLR